MPRRNIVFANDEYYHIYNRSSGGIEIFKGNNVLKRSLALLEFYRYPQRLRFSKYQTLPVKERKVYEENFRKEKQIVEIFAFSLIHNHYHILLKQKSDFGINKFVSNFQNSLARYFNIRNERYGGVFQGPFKAKHVANEKYLLHLSKYIHLNHITSFIINLNDLDSYPWSSFPYYLNIEINKNNLVNTELITKIVGGKNKYRSFVRNQADYQRSLNKIQGLLID